MVRETAEPESARTLLKLERQRSVGSGARAARAVSPGEPLFPARKVALHVDDEIRSASIAAQFAVAAHRYALLNSTVTDF
jgi:hypothetical protein